ncbi:MAG: transposase [Bacteroidetes bacterium]|nr:transposase [Bacteroidota bacterium]
MISILHTWGQQISLHPHLHCVIPQGGLTKNNQWKYAKSKGKYLFPVKAMSKVLEQNI